MSVKVRNFVTVNFLVVDIFVSVCVKLCVTDEWTSWHTFSYHFVTHP